MYALTALTLLLAAASAIPTPKPEGELQQCNDQYYDPSLYVCYSGTLCPVVNGENTQECASDCFTSYQYDCKNSSLVEKTKKTQGAFTLTAQSSQASLDGQAIQAAGSYFYVGGHASTTCPTSIAGLCNSFPNDTTLFFNTYLGTTVPGGQALYWQTDGALAFTQAHSGLTHNLSSLGGGVAYENGGYFGPNGEDLITCPVNNGNSTSWKLFARLPNVTFSDGCVGLYGVVHDSNLTSGAWQYI